MPRCQVLMQPEVYSRMKTLAKFDRRTLSAMCAELIDQAMRLPKYQAMFDEAVVSVGEVPTQPDPRSTRKQEHRPITIPAAIKEEDRERYEAFARAEAIRQAEEGPQTEDGQLAAQLSSANIRHTQAMPQGTRAQQQKLQQMRLDGKLTAEEFIAVGSSQVLKEDEDKLVKEVDMKLDLLKTIGEQPQQLDQLKALVEAMEKLKS